MSTTVDNSHESMILIIDEAAAYLAIPKATLYTWRTRRVGFGPRREGGRLPALPARGPRRLDRRTLSPQRACRPWPGRHSPSAPGGLSPPRRSSAGAIEP
jgi:hypothetical protein